MLTTNQIIGQNILGILNKKSMTQAALAEKLGCTRQEINKIVHGRKNITVQELKEIAAILNVPIEELTKEKNVTENIEPITMFLGQVKTKEAKIGLLHAQKIMDMILFHSQVQENKSKLIKDWDV
ncbi:DNA-binding transcriptional regulator, XRE-family HTH domain [Carboxydocella sporoproducens DSM 16521]|uniref:DNA-binding transcriptional regulator, XRE-family HTH domain n=2 Tax=Carboxydocella TaxID=178898 RepID=A0A1T4SGZ9_9FIRM|nr:MULTISPECIES: helix-turn-helix transcriptional regulator [Carboxydocella]AVX19633.1 DNA-binding transcriptional regulator, XRE-family HTH domain [Carboxydocella thermautotrophica]SKA27443.1 DNA-binding transcriptional regulator, XRE-family HTH domain [Carboxydocella sporoproducens DSM 16521]